MKIDWNKFDELVTEMADKVRSEYWVDVVVGVGRNGLVPAATVAEELGVSEFCSVSVRFYDDGKPPERVLERPRIMHNDVGDLSGKRVLVVDDFCRSGLTLAVVEKLLVEKGAEEVKSAVIVLREDAKAEPDYYGLKFNGCVIFPWNT